MIIITLGEKLVLVLGSVLALSVTVLVLNCYRAAYSRHSSLEYQLVRNREKMLRQVAFFFALVFIALGILRFFPHLVRNDNQFFFNIFEVSTGHSFFYILTGLFGLSASASITYARLYFKIFGVCYGLLSILGFALDGNLGLLHITMPDSFFYLIVSVIAVYIGFTSKIKVGY